MFATSLALIAQAFSGKERGTAFGIYGAVIGGAVAIGPLLGGAITSGIGWRWIFFINLPIGRGRRRHHPGQGAGLRGTRPPGASTGSGSSPSRPHCSCWCTRWSQGNAKGWRSPTIVGLLVGSGVLMVVFLVAEWLQRGSRCST